MVTFLYYIKSCAILISPMQTTLIKIQPETPSVTSYIFVKPPGFTFKPGQFINFEILHENPDNRGVKRNCSIASSPTDEYLMVSLRHGVSTFKKALEKIQIGTEIKFIGPLGHFVLNEDQAIPAVFLTGGIGVTPFHSMIKYTTVNNLLNKITLIYSNRAAVDVPFKAELDTLDGQNENLNIHWTMTQDPTWTGSSGRIDEGMIHTLVPQIETAEFYTCGPPLMVQTMRELLEKMGVTKERVKFEQFTGY